MTKTAYVAGSFSAFPQTYAELAGLEAAIAQSWPGADGWMQYASGIVARAGTSEHKTGDGEAGWPLAGEWVSDGVSYALRQKGDGWVLTTYTSSATEHRIVEHRVLSDVLNRRPMAYEVLWTPVSTGSPAVDVWTPTASRFVGWT